MYVSVLAYVCAYVSPDCIWLSVGLRLSVWVRSVILFTPAGLPVLHSAKADQTVTANCKCLLKQMWLGNFQLAGPFACV